MALAASSESETQRESKMKVFRLEETREEIVKYLRPKDIKNLSLVSTEWKEFLDKPKYWRRFRIFLTNENFSEVLINERLIVRNKVAIWYKIKTENGDDNSVGQPALMEKLKIMIDQQETKLSKLAILMNPRIVTFPIEEITESVENVSISWDQLWFQKKPDQDRATAILNCWNLRQWCRRYVKMFVYRLMKEIKSGSGRLKELSLDCRVPWSSGRLLLGDSGLPCDPGLFAAAITKLTVFKYFGETIETDHLRALFETIIKHRDQINLRRVYLGIPASVWIKIRKDLHGEFCEAKKHVKFYVQK